MKKTTLPFFYSLSFAIVNFAEATVQLLCLGLYSPSWVFRFVAWYTLRTLRNKRK